MKYLRIKKDSKYRWTITTNQKDVSLDGRDLRLVITDPHGRELVVPFEIDGCTAIFSWPGTEHRSVGPHTFTMWEKFRKTGQNAVDKVAAVTLVSTSDEEGGESSCHNLQIETIDLGTSDFRGIGVDGITPLLKTEDNYWYVSYDKGKTWNQLGKCVGKDGQDGLDGNCIYPKLYVNSEMELVIDSDNPTDRIEFNQATGELILNI